MNCYELRNRDVMKEVFLPKVIIELLKFVGDFWLLEFPGSKAS